MPTFAYQARDKMGARVEGQREATDRDEVLRLLRDGGLFVTKLAPVASNTANEYSIEGMLPNASGRAASVGRDVWAHANSKDVSLFFRQMHAMLHAGTSVSRALKILSENATNKSLGRAAQTMTRRTGEGENWSATMRAYPGLFSPLAVNMIVAGERGGFLERMCLRLSEYCERDYELQQTVRRETFYPKILLFCSVLIPSVVTLVLAGFRPWLAQVTPALTMLALIWFAVRVLNRMLKVGAHGGALRMALDSAKLHVPVFGKTVRALATAKFCRALGALQSAGVGPEAAFLVSGESCGNAWVARSVANVAPRLRGGTGFTEALTATKQFPPVALQMMATGEETGSMDLQLDKVADFLESEAETFIRQSVKLLGVLVFLAMAIYIASIVIGMYGGYTRDIGKLIGEP
jgi:type II secretory pathway component PulF